MPDETRSVPPKKRPRGLRWLCMGLVSVGLVNGVAALRTAQLAPDYLALGVSFPPVLGVVWGLVWGAAFLWGAGRLWRLRNGSRRQVLVLVGAYGGLQALWWRVFARSDYAVQRWPFAVLLTALLVALVFWYLTRPHLRALLCASVSGTAPTRT